MAAIYLNPFTHFVHHKYRLLEYLCLHVIKFRKDRSYFFIIFPEVSRKCYSEKNIAHLYLCVKNMCKYVFVCNFGALIWSTSYTQLLLVLGQQNKLQCKKFHFELDWCEQHPHLKDTATNNNSRKQQTCWCVWSTINSWWRNCH